MGESKLKADIPLGRLERFGGSGAGPRRWAWWFGTPWLAIGFAAWWFQSDALLILAVLFFGAACITFVVDGFRTGVIDAKWSAYDRVKSPGMFWFHVMFYSLFGLALLMAAVAKLMTRLAG
jgi:hypothetical protein